ncbi:hypothetical protein ACVWZD_002107 [Streptomyces sp. TE3672]
MNTSPTVVNASDLHVSWWKSSASGAQSDCVECGIVGAASVAVRDSKVPNGPALIFGRDTFSAMIDAVAGGLA